MNSFPFYSVAEDKGDYLKVVTSIPYASREEAAGVMLATFKSIPAPVGQDLPEYEVVPWAPFGSEYRRFYSKFKESGP